MIKAMTNDKTKKMMNFMGIYDRGESKIGRERDLILPRSFAGGGETYLESG